MYLIWRGDRQPHAPPAATQGARAAGGAKGLRARRRGDAPAVGAAMQPARRSRRRLARGVFPGREEVLRNGRPAVARNGADDADAAVGDDGEVELPRHLRALRPNAECVVDVRGGLGGAEASDAAEVTHSGVGTAAQFGEAHVSGFVTGAAEGDEPRQTLNAPRGIVVPALVGLQRGGGGAALASAASARVNVPPETVPVGGMYAVADVCEPAAARDEVDEESIAPKRPVFTLQFGNLSGLLIPPVQQGIDSSPIERFTSL